MSAPEILAALREATETGAELARSAFLSRSFDLEWKTDGSPVTSADVEVEHRMSQLLRDRVPDAPLAGEELEHGAEETWDRYIAIDPIDGTSNFVRGVPFFAVTAVYVDGGRPTAGVVVDAIHRSTYWALRGEGAYRDGQRLRAPGGAATLADATVAMTAESLPPELRGDFLKEIADQANRHQALRAVSLEIAGLACGWFDAAVFHEIAVWDFGAAALILEEAGGRWTDLHGRRPDLSRPTAAHSFCGALSAELHERLLRMAGRGL